MRMKSVATFLLATISIVGLAAGCSNTRKDEAVAQDIQAKMFSDPQVKSANISVAVKDGEATLSGDVTDDATRLQAYKIASDTPGVKHVTDQMTVQTAQTAPAAEPVPVEPPPVSRPERKAPKQHAKSSLSSKKIESEPAPVEPPPAPAAVTPPPERETADAPPPLPPQPRRVVIPAGTSVRVQMIDGVDSSVNHTGEMFHATLASPIAVDNQIVVPAGTDMYVKLMNAKSAGHMTGKSELVLELVRMDFQGRSYTLASNDYEQTGASRGKRTAETVGGGAVLGTLLGAVIGGEKGAAIGAATGAGAGTVVQGATKGQQVQVPSETKLDFSLDQSVEVTYFPERNRSMRR